jgi:release factor glutamine methyltransferase
VIAAPETPLAPAAKGISSVSLAAALADAAERLMAAGVDGARRDARLLLGAVVPGGASTLLRDPQRLLLQSEAQRFEAMLLRREKREPVSRIIGEREFWSLTFRITPDTLDPRPDSETLIEGILEWVGDRTRPLRILDLGTGTGCLLLALLSELPNAMGRGIDISPEALAVARENAGSLGLACRSDFVCGDWTEGLDGKWDIILSNPPYIVETHVSDLAPEVSNYDPFQALAGGSDGLRDYRVLIPGATGLMSPEALLALEVGAGQAAAVEAMMQANGLGFFWRRCDLSGVERCCFAVKAKK